MEKFVFKDKLGKTFEVYCETKGSRWGFKHTARAEYNGDVFRTSSTYQNRTWERYRYESVLSQLANKIAGNDSDNLKAFKACVDAKAQEEKEACDAWFNNFKKGYDGLSDKTKKMLADSDIMLTSKEQADDVLKSAQIIDAIMSLL